MGKRRASAYTPEERKLGQLNWAARQGRCDLTFASSLVQQPAGQGKAQAPCWMNSAVRRSEDSHVQQFPATDAFTSEAGLGPKEIDLLSLVAEPGAPA